MDGVINACDGEAGKESSMQICTYILQQQIQEYTNIKKCSKIRKTFLRKSIHQNFSRVQLSRTTTTKKSVQ